MLEAEETPAPRLDERIVKGTEDLGPVNTPLPEAPKPKREVFSRTGGALYFADSYMVTAKGTPRFTETPQPRFQVETEVVTGDKYYEGSEDEYDKVQELDESSNSHIRSLSYSDA